MKIVIGTRNAGKLEELRKLLPKGAELLTLDDVQLDSPEETGTTFDENARIKARHASQAGYLTLADDSGLVVDALGGAPGVRSSRYAGEHATDEANNRKLIEDLALASSYDRSARFMSVVVAVTPNGAEAAASGSVEGYIVDDPRGSNGFGYDPHFALSDPETNELNGRTMAELTLHEKNEISHRARAYRALLGAMRDAGGELATSLRLLLPDESDGRIS